ncbi:TRAP-type C4-dicarboxylate transport system permease small subunit [Variovorax boronicumulans]|uniref:TRAP transporter small permease n=1 Tax=Variovorax boronicumulans TaxID=436515 RepID=UPI002787D451|nr:TRAP transporter small permease [Variovorax boronicumulans]MDP9910717.1 TRAP-type C4-dicarboxylate transport system permease small subunit [Variovorax boronicumulans]
MQENALKESGGLSRRVLDASDLVLRCERHLLSSLMGLLIVLVLLNVVTRYGGFPLYWVDEASVYCVVWLTFIGASAMTRLRLDFAVTLLTDKLGTRAARVAKASASGGVLLLGLALLAMCWLWMDPAGIVRHGFDAKEFAAESFNFLYTERTQTLDWPTWVVQLILPIFALTLSVHALANFLEDLGLQPKRTHDEFHVANADAVN